MTARMAGRGRDTLVADVPTLLIVSTTAGSVVRSVSSTSDTRSSFHEHGDEPSIDHAALMDVLVHAGYTGLITSEWEGHAYIDHFSGWGMRHGQQDLLARLLRSAQPTVSAMSTGRSQR